ncbi:ABC-three component system protein [Pectobacterium cacticida]|uniref:ABC-three component system protein n=1 Tax=Pectobacterium cacticida TaxID=69221 RepID=UPI002FF0FF20
MSKAIRQNRPETEDERKALITALQQEIAMSKAPLLTLYGGQYPMSHFSDDIFELFVGDICTELKGQDEWDWYDSVHRFSGGADAGRDVILHKEGICVGTIQCKKYNKPVQLSLVLEELTKYLLYGHVKTGMLPPSGQEFRWYLAVSESTGGTATEFLVGAGEAHMKGYRSALEAAAQTARDSSVFLKGHPSFEKLNSSELCDLIWSRLIDIRPGLLRKSELSVLVRRLPVVAATYYQIQKVITGDITDLIEPLKRFLQNANCSHEQLSETQNVLSSYIPGKLLEGENLNVVMMPECADTLRLLHNTTQTVRARQFGSASTVIISSACSFQPCDYEDIHRIISSSKGQVILVAGCGKVSGETLIEWRETGEILFPCPEWDPAPVQKYQAGWCWIKQRSGETACYLLLENVPADHSDGQGTHHHCFIFEDVCFWPVLGADFFCSVSASKAMLNRLAMSVEETSSAIRKHALAVCASQCVEDEKIKHALAHFEVLREKTDLAFLCCHPSSTRYKNGLRTFCGAYPCADSSHMLMSTRGIVESGVVIRSDQTAVASFSAYWKSHTLQLLRPSLFRVEGNMLVSDYIPLFAELLSHVTLYESKDDSPYPNRAKDKLCLQYLADKGMSSSLIVHHCMNKLKPYVPVLPDTVSWDNTKLARHAGLNSYLSCHPELEWQTECNKSGTLKWAYLTSIEHIVLLEDPDLSYRQIKAEVLLWAAETGEHPKLRVLAKGRGNRMDHWIAKTGEVHRVDITQPDYAGEHEITEIHVNRQAELHSLSVLDDYYLEDTDGSGLEKFVRSLRKDENEL